MPSELSRCCNRVSALLQQPGEPLSVSCCGHTLALTKLEADNGNRVVFVIMLISSIVFSGMAWSVPIV